LLLLRKKIGNPVFFVFSDDITYAREPAQGLQYCVSDHNDESMGMKLRSDVGLPPSCRAIAPSWWGAWLTPTRELVCAPGKLENRADDLPDPGYCPKDWLRTQPRYKNRVLGPSQQQ